MEKKKILIVDDEQDIEVLVKNLLGKDKFEYDYAENGMQGYEKIAKNQPDLVVLDVQMPKLDGFGMLKRLVDNKIISDLPVIFLTGIAAKRGAHFKEVDVQNYYQSDLISYIEKPLDPEKFKELVAQKLS